MSKVGIYARISRTDEKDFHVSIENQIKGITDYCNKNNLNIIKIYQDIGYTGSNFVEVR